MNLWYVLFAVLGGWSVMLGIHTVIESWAIARHREHLETRAWTEKVDAMRRMHDEEGEA
jgi:hypothetical protein